MRASRPPSVFNVVLHGLGAGAAATTVNGLVYAVVFGVIGDSVHRWTGSTILAGYPGPLFPLFLGTLFSGALSGGVVSLPYSVLCRFFPHLAGLAGGIGFLIAVGGLMRVLAPAIWGSAPIQCPGALGVFVSVTSLVSTVIVGAVIGQAELVEREIS
jgi:hypothetical protein